MSLTREEFLKIYRQIKGSSSSIDRSAFYTVLCCAGKTCIRSHIDSLWPTDQKEIEFDHAFRIFEKLEDLIVDENDLDKLRRNKTQVTVAQVIESLQSVRESEKGGIAACFAPFQTDGMVAIEEFIRAVEWTKNETLNKLLSRSSPLSEPSSPVMLSREYFRSKYNEIEGTTVRGVLFTNPLRAVKYRLETGGEGTAELTLRVERNCDMKSNMFANDIFAMVTGPDGEIIAITDRLDGENFRTRKFNVMSGCSVAVFCLGTVPAGLTKEKPRIDLIDKKQNKLSKRFRMTLMNIFEMFDFDCDGLHCREEYAAFSIATADIPPDDEDWELLISQFDSREEALTLSGFLFIHECEAFSGDDLAIPDIWESLHRLGYDGNLQMNTTCPFSITLHLENSHVMAIPQLSLMNKQNRDFMLMRVYELGEEDITCDILPRIYRTEYFGMMIVSKNKVYNQDIYKLDIIKEKNVRWNFVCGIDDIMPWNSSTDWILIASYSATQQQHTALFRLVKER